VLVVAAALIVPLAVGQTLSFAESLRSGRYDEKVARLVEVVPEQYRDDARRWADRIIHPQSKPTAERLEGERLEGERLEGERLEGERLEGERLEGERPVGEGTQSHSKPSGESRDDEAGRTSTSAGDSAVSSAEAAALERNAVVDRVLPSLPDAAGGISLDNPVFALLGAGASQVYAFALRLLGLSLVTFLIPFYVYYFSVHWPQITGFFADLVPDDRKGTVFGIVAEMDRAVAGFVRGRIVISFLMGVMFAIGWQICGVPYGIALGLLVGALSIVPYLGGIGLPIAVGLLMADQFGLDAADRMSVLSMILWPSVVFIVVQSVEGYVLTPIIAGKATDLDPVTIVVAILAGGSVAGVYGMLLAIPVAACGKIAAKRLLLPRIKEWARGRASDPLPLDQD
jgi:predicted PurR-regulated permease PerM